MRIWVLVTEGAFDSGLTTVLDVLRTADLLREETPHPPPPFEVTLVGARRHLHTAGGLRVTTGPPDGEAPDVLVVPALGLGAPAEVARIAASRPLRRTLDVIATAAAGGTRLAGACSGVFLLAEAGTLDGRAATTSWWLGSEFRRRYPRVELDTGATLLVGDEVSTAGAAFAHIDLALSLVQRRSPALADLVARYLLIGERASQAAFAVPTVLARHSPEMAAFERWVRAHLDAPLRMADAAVALGLSERTLQRVTGAAVGMSPVEFVNEVRLDEAAFLLRSTALTAEAVAHRVGFRNVGTLRALARRRRRTTLRELRGVGPGPERGVGPRTTG